MVDGNDTDTLDTLVKQALRMLRNDVSDGTIHMWLVHDAHGAPCPDGCDEFPMPERARAHNVPTARLETERWERARRWKREGAQWHAMRHVQNTWHV